LSRAHTQVRPYRQAENEKALTTFAVL
jgi:hypothetical protein